MIRRKNKTALPMLITASVLSVLFAAGGFFYGFFFGDPYVYERAETVYLNSYEDLAALEKDEVLNDRYFLTADIVVEGELSIGTAEHPFAGVFEGNGYTVTYKGAKSALFGYISSKASVSGLTVAGDISSSSLFAAGIADVNYGNISDCKVEDVSFTLGEGVRYAGGVVALNYGTVSCCMSGARFNGSDGMHVFAGGVAGYNEGQLSSSVVTVQYFNFSETDIENNYDGSFSNHGVGAVTGVDEGEVTACGAEETDDYLTDARAEGVAFLPAETLYDPDYIFLSAGFSHSVWEYVGGKYVIQEGGAL